MLCASVSICETSGALLRAWLPVPWPAADPDSAVAGSMTGAMRLMRRCAVARNCSACAEALERAAAVGLVACGFNACASCPSRAGSSNAAPGNPARAGTRPMGWWFTVVTPVVGGGGNKRGLPDREASFVSLRCARGGRAASGSSCAASTCRTVYLLRGVISLRSSPECQGGVPSSAPDALARTLHSLPPTLYRASRPQFLPYAVNRALTDWQPRGDAARCPGPCPGAPLRRTNAPRVGQATSACNL